VRASLFGLFHVDSRLHAVCLGFIGGGDTAGMLGDEGDNADGTAPQFWALLLLDRSEVRVQVKEEPLHGGSRTFRELWEEAHGK
jgi:hypothetical protein